MVPNRLVLLFLLGLLQSSCEKKSTPALRPADFHSFAGIDRGATKEKLVALYGAPESEERSEDGDGFWLSFADGEVTAWVTSGGRVQSVDVHSKLGLEFVRSRGVNDSKLKILGSSYKSMLSRMGRPTGVTADSYTFFSDTVSVGTSCYDFEEHRCLELGVQWFLDTDKPSKVWWADFTRATID